MGSYTKEQAYLYIGLSIILIIISIFLLYQAFYLSQKEGFLPQDTGVYLPNLVQTSYDSTVPQNFYAVQRFARTKPYARFIRIDSGSDYLNFSHIQIINKYDYDLTQLGSLVVSSSGNYSGTNNTMPITNVASITVARGWPNIFHSSGGNAWFEIDLGTSSNMDTRDLKRVIIYNRGDCCQERLNGYFLRVLAADRTLINGWRLNSNLVQTYEETSPFCGFNSGLNYRPEIDSTFPCFAPCRSTADRFSNGTCFTSCPSPSTYINVPKPASLGLMDPWVVDRCNNPCDSGAGYTRSQTDPTQCVRQCPLLDVGGRCYERCRTNETTIIAERVDRQIPYCFPPTSNEYIMVYISSNETNNDGGLVYIADGIQILNGTAPWRSLNIYMKKIFVKRGLLVGITQQNQIWFGGNYKNPTWRRIKSISQENFEDISFDGNTLIGLTTIKNVGTKLQGREMYYTTQFNLSRPNWIKVRTAERVRNITHWKGVIIASKEYRDTVTSTTKYDTIVSDLGADFTTSPKMAFANLTLNVNFGMLGPNPYVSLPLISYDGRWIYARALDNGPLENGRIIMKSTSDGNLTAFTERFGVDARGYASSSLTVIDGKVVFTNKANQLLIGIENPSSNWDTIKYMILRNNVQFADMWIGDSVIPPPVTADSLFRQYTPEMNKGIARCRGVTARYVRVLRSSTSPDVEPYIQISQLVVFNTAGQNIALNKPTSASSTLGNLTSNYAVDGVLDPRIPPAIFHSGGFGPGEWWEVDLQQNAEIAFVVYQNRADCCGARSIGMGIQLLDSNRNQVALNRLTTDDVEQAVGFCTEGLPTCRGLGTPGVIDGVRRRIYSLEECTTLGGQYNYSLGTCGAFSTDCAGYPDSPADPPLVNQFDIGAKGLCRFNPILYGQSYPDITSVTDVNGNFDIGKLRSHWVTTGISQGKSPCGSVNMECGFSSDAYFFINPDLKATVTNALSHYTTTGLNTGRIFCYVKGFIPSTPLLPELTTKFQTKTRVTPPSTSKCKLVELGLSRQWLCPTDAEASTLLAGPPSSTSTTYLDVNDTVCVANQNNQTVYYCKSIELDPSGKSYNYKLASGHTDTCDIFAKNVADLSQNIVALNAMSTTASFTKDKIDLARSQLQSLYNSMSCSSATSINNARLKTLCDTISATISKMGTNSSSVGTLITQVTGPLQTAITSRTDLMDSLQQFQCKS